MGKNSDIISISNSLSITILHEILIEHTNRQESVPYLSKEIIEYKGLSIKKISKVNLNERDKKKIKDMIIKKINNRLKMKYPDVKVSQKKINKKVDEELFYFFE
ncbi:hypothetical protein COU59_01035 [Candidatus Pacearchaeota archaeon CG10_big_fil_rev_8_21_14_0_10_34_12]|nr:MAG: hypothetical protein COU59_01035 [Candidatus Pacearchaeota archaeon CG10_big_fil_rev_8_21_14_0_10_34_12]